jgi:hypothetical protein
MKGIMPPARNEMSDGRILPGSECVVSYPSVTPTATDTPSHQPRPRLSRQTAQDHGPTSHKPTEGDRLQIEAHQALQYYLTQVAMLYLFEWQLTVAWLEPFCSAAPVGAGDLPPRCGLAASDRPLPPKFQPPTRPASWPVARMGFSCREDTPRVDWIVGKPEIGRLSAQCTVGPSYRTGAKLNPLKPVT